MNDIDLVIVGSGFGASITAMIARRLGYRVVLLERGRHPRFAIGESASPLAGILIEQLSDRYGLPRLRPLSAFGSWQSTYPHIGCGLKRGFTYFKHEVGTPYRSGPGRRNQLLVAASPSDELSDTHWLRRDVDHFLVQEAVALGAEYHDEVQLQSVEWQPGGDPVLVGTRHGRALRIRSRFVLDASGPRGFLSHALGIADRGFGGYPPTQALFSHFMDVKKCEDLDDYGAEVRGCEGARVLGAKVPGATVRGPDLALSHLRTFAPSTLAPPHPHTVAPSHAPTLASDLPPYPIDAAALHHVFDGGWMWVLRFGNGVTSAGVAVEDWLAQELRIADGAPAWARLMDRYPSVAAQFAEATPMREFTWMPRTAYRAAEAAGERWAMLPSAAAFVDPLFSTGIPLTLLGIERFARTLEDRSFEPASYARATLDDADRTARFIAGSYAAFRRFDLFAAYSMFYFAAASFSEMARRLSSPRTPRGFLCGDSAEFTAALDRLSPARCGEVALDAYERDIAAAVADWNIAGLCDPAKENWYGVDLDDTVRAAAKLGLSPEQVRARAG